MNDFLDFVRQYKWRILLVCFGILFTILLFTIGFWRTIILFIIVGLCYVLGMLLDESGRTGVRDFFSSLFKRD